MPDLLSSPDGEDFFCKPLETAAKRRKGAGNEVPCWGLGQSPKRNPFVTPNREAIPKKQESGSEAFLIPRKPLKTACLVCFICFICLRAGYGNRPAGDGLRAPLGKGK